MSKRVRIAIPIVLAVAIVAVVSLKQRSRESAMTEATLAPVSNNVWGDSGPAEATREELPRLVDVGAEQCIPCKMMAPVLQELRVEYAGVLQVDFVDVWKNPAAGEPYNVHLIPTQIFYGSSGQELFRHQGFISKEDILQTWKRLGYDLKPAPAKG
jgi:thiol-disulfide isomerase/thioredoxin